MQEIADAKITAKKNRSADDEGDPLALLVAQRKIPVIVE